MKPKMACIMVEIYHYGASNFIYAFPELWIFSLHICDLKSERISLHGNYHDDIALIWCFPRV